LSHDGAKKLSTFWVLITLKIQIALFDSILAGYPLKTGSKTQKKLSTFYQQVINILIGQNPLSSLLTRESGGKIFLFCLYFNGFMGLFGRGKAGVSSFPTIRTCTKNYTQTTIYALFFCYNF
jgi:hypothetical protein